MDYDVDALNEISLLGEVLAAAAHAHARIPARDLDRVMEVRAGHACRSSAARRVPATV